MNQNYKQVKISPNQRNLIWVFLKNSSKEKPLIVIQTEPGEDIRLNFKEDLLSIEVEKI